MVPARSQSLRPIILAIAVTLAAIAAPVAAGAATPQPRPRPHWTVPRHAARIVTRHVDAVPGRPVKLAVFASIKRDCTSGALPTVRLSKPPHQGRIIVRRARLHINNHGACLSADVGALVAFYRAGVGASGKDSATLTISAPNGRVMQLNRYNITITAAAAGTSL